MFLFTHQSFLCACVLVSFFFLIAHLIILPFKKTPEQRVQTAALIGIFMMLLIGMALDMSIPVSEQAAMGYILIVLTCIGLSLNIYCFF